MEKHGFGFRGGASVATAILLSLLSLESALAAAAASLSDLCPGTPDPCVVSGQFTVADGTVFDAGGRAVQVLAGASLVGSGAARFSIVDAASIDLQSGSLLTTTPSPSAFYMHCPPNDGATVAPDEPLARFIGEEANGTWTLTTTNNSISDLGTLTAWGIEVCTAGGCVLYPSADVPHTIPGAYDYPNNHVSSVVSVGASGPVTHVAVIRLKGTFGPFFPRFQLVSPSGTGVAVLGDIGDAAFCLIPQTDVSLADPTSSDADIFLQATGACALAGAINLDAPTNGNHAGALWVDCGSVALGADLDLRARGRAGAGGAVVIEARAGGVTTAGGAIRLPGRGSHGGILRVRATGACSLDPIRLEADGYVAPGMTLYATGGELSLACNGISVAGRSRIRMNGGGAEGNGSGGAIRFDAGSGGFSSGNRGSISLRSPDFFSGGSIQITAAGNCSIGGKIDTRAVPRTFNDEGDFSVARGNSGMLTASCGGSIVVPSKAKLKLGTALNYAPDVELRAGTTVEIEPQASVNTDGISSAGFLSTYIEAPSGCSVNGKLRGRGARDWNGPMLFRCASFSIGPRGEVASGSAGAPSLDLTIDTTGVDLGIPPGPCDIAGKLTNKGRSLNVNDTGNGGTIYLNCGTTTTLQSTGRIDVSCTGIDGEAGAVFVNSGGNLLLAGQMSGGGTFSGGRYYIDACDITLPASGTITSGGFGGPISLTAHHDLDIAGSIHAFGLGGALSMVYRNAASITGQVSPPSVPVQNMALAPCP